MSKTFLKFLSSLLVLSLTGCTVQLKAGGMPPAVIGTDAVKVYTVASGSQYTAPSTKGTYAITIYDSQSPAPRRSATLSAADRPGTR